MTSPSNSRCPQAGISVLEMLIALAILAVITGVAATQLRGPSQALTNSALLAALCDQAVMMRIRAMQTETEQSFLPDLPSSATIVACVDGEPRREIYFLPGGQVDGGPLCIQTDRERVTIEIDWLTGQLRRAK